MNISSRLFVGLFLITQLSLALAKDSKHETYMRSSEFQKQLYDVGVHWDRNVLGLEKTCASKYFLKPISVSYLKPLKYENDSIYPTSGVWTTRFNFIRCEKTIVYNVIGIAQAKGKPKISRLVPGTTAASPTLLRDLYIQAIPIALGLKAKDKSCEDAPQISDTQITMKPTTIKSGGATYKGVWEEKWAVQFCEENIDVTLCLIPDGKGGTSFSSGKCKK